MSVEVLEEFQPVLPGAMERLTDEEVQHQFESITGRLSDLESEAPELLEKLQARPRAKTPAPSEGDSLRFDYPDPPQ